MQDREAYLFKVYGVVQGVNFRYTAMLKAAELGISGWIRNLSDGGVEGYAEGAPDAVERFLRWCRRGPETARVEKIIVTRSTLQNLEGFSIKNTI